MRNNIILNTIIPILLVCVASFPVTMMGKRIIASPYVMQEGVICRIDMTSNTATLVGVTEFSGHSFPESVTSGGIRFRITSIAPYCLWPSAATSPDSITLPGSIRKIGERAFAGFPRLRHVNLPDSLEHIGEWAFAYTSLENVTLPKSLRTIMRGTFEGCSRLSDVNLNYIKIIENAAFKDCAIRWVTINGESTLIGRDAFSGCDVVFLRLEDFRYTLYPLVSLSSQFGSDRIPWIKVCSKSYFFSRPFPKFPEDRSVIVLDNRTWCPVYISFEDTGNLENEWSSGNEYLWPATDPLRTASRSDYVAFSIPARIRIDTSELPIEGLDSLKIKVLYNNMDITSTMRGDTVFLTEGRKYRTPKDFKRRTYSTNKLEIQYFWAE